MEASLPLLLTDSLGNTSALTEPILNYMVAAVSALVLLLFYAGGRDKLAEEELLEGDKVLIVEEASLESAVFSRRLTPRPSFLLPSPSFSWPQQSQLLEEVR